MLTCVPVYQPMLSQVSMLQLTKCRWRRPDLWLGERVFDRSVDQFDRPAFRVLYLCNHVPRKDYQAFS